ncbi:MAG: hypothetical protein Q9170_005889 [Blastenia crenularia]
MPGILGIERPRRSSRHSSTSQRPLSQAPAVKQSTSPIEVKKPFSASKAQLRSPKRQEAATKCKPTPRSSPTEEVVIKSNSKRDIDVFAFMDNSEDGEDHQHTEDEHEEDDAVDSIGPDTAASSPVLPNHPSSHYSDLEVNADQQSKRQTWHGGFNQAGSFHSDSGISMGSSSGDADSPIQQHKYPSIRRTSTHEPSIPEHHGFNISSAPFSIRSTTFSTDAWPQASIVPNETPEAYYARPNHAAPKPLDIPVQLPITPPELSPQLTQSRKPQPKKKPSEMRHGYSQLASRISSQEDAVLKPVYRKFETLNNRILLYLQDEISELEAELEKLDASISHEEQCMGRGGYPSSRRAEAKAPSQLQWHRGNLIERCTSKVETYNRTLSSYSNLTQTLCPSSNSDVNAYRTWIKKHNSIAKPEASFLNDRHDLITVSQTKHRAPLTNLKYSPVTVALTILTTIIVFKFVPQFFARLVMSAVIGLALMCMVSPSSLLDLQMLKEKKRGVGVYATVMLMLAIVVD